MIYTDTRLHADKVVELLLAKGIRPDYSFTAAAGEEFGSIIGFVLPDEQTVVARFSDSGFSFSWVENCRERFEDGSIFEEVVAEDVSDPCDLANLIGVEKVASEEYEPPAPVLVVRTEFRSDGRQFSQYVGGEFPSVEDAREFVERRQQEERLPEGVASVKYWFA